MFNYLLKIIPKIFIVNSLASGKSQHTNFTFSVNLNNITQSLGHKNITITLNYIQSGFNNKKIDYLNKNLDKKHRNKY